MSPLVSIVVPTFNQAAFIEQTLASIVGQGWPRLELIVIDGGSTDGTAEIVRRFPVTHFISERDQGQGDAINKGFRLATGDILAWLNSDDYYLPLTLARVARALEGAPGPRLVYGSCLLWFEQEDRARMARARPFTPEALHTSSFIYQPSAFWNRAMWEAVGELNIQYHYVLDWDWWLRASRAGELVAVEACLSVYRFHAQHKTGANAAPRTEEICALVERTAAPEWAAAFRAVAARLPAMARSWRRGYRWHKLRHLDLYARHGAKVDVAFWQLHV